MYVFFATAVLKLFLYRVTTKASLHSFTVLNVCAFYWNGYFLNIHIIPSVSSSYTFSSTIYFILFCFILRNQICLTCKVNGIWFETSSGSHFILNPEPVISEPKSLTERAAHYHWLQHLLSPNLPFLEFLRFQVIICFVTFLVDIQYEWTSKIIWIFNWYFSLLITNLFK